MARDYLRVLPRRFSSLIGTSRAVIAIETPVRATFEVTVASLGEDNSIRAMVSFADVSHVREAEQMRSDFVANVSHELRSPLTALSGFIETLKGAAKDDDAARSRFLDLMDHEAQRMMTIRLNTPDDLEPGPGDDDELVQVFQNLIENAIKYGAPDSEITITITKRDEAAGMRGPALAVRDP